MYEVVFCLVLLKFVIKYFSVLCFQLIALALESPNANAITAEYKVWTLDFERRDLYQCQTHEVV